MPRTADLARDKARARALAIAESMSDQEDVARVQAARADKDNPPVPADARFERADEMRRRPGRPRLPSPKQQVTLRLDREVIEGMRALGAGWQVRVNAMLKAWLASAK